MLEILNRYSHGLAAIPILHALRERGCLTRLAETTSVSAEQLTREFSANRAYLDVALRMLVCLEWIRPVGAGRFEATPRLTSASVIPDRIMDLYRFPFDLYIQGRCRESLEPWLEMSERRWNTDHLYLPDYLDGLLIVPLLLPIRTQGQISIVDEKDAGKAEVTLRLNVDQTTRGAIERLFLARGWAVRSADGLHINRAGRFIIERIPVTAATASYRPMFVRAYELLFGDASGVFALDPAGHETHLDRTLNVIGSGFQHEKYFAALSEMVVRCFDNELYSSQPKYIADTGCGDGSLLRRLYEMVRDRTRRGKVLDEHPLILIAIDYNDEALAVAERNLLGLEHIVMKGDIGEPLGLQQSLHAHGVEDLERVLHVRSFLDHDRPYVPPEDRTAATRRSQLGGSAIYIDGQGHAIPPGDMIQSTIEHLCRWSRLVNSHGLVMLEVHCLSPEVTARYLDESENFHFDAYHALSHQYLLEAQTFFLCAAEAGLFCGPGRSLGFPRNLPFTRISLSHFERRPYVIRRAYDEDLPALSQLDQVWAQPQAGFNRDKDTLELPPAVFVLETEGRLMASVRCDEANTIQLASASERLGASATYLRDLLEFVEQYWALVGIGLVIGIQDCRSALSAVETRPSIARAVASDVRAFVGQYPFTADDDPRAAERELGMFSLRWLLANLQRMGVMRDAGEAYDLDALKRRLGIVPRYDRYFDALIRRLQEEGLVAICGSRIETTPLVSGYALASAEVQVAEFKQRFRERYPASVGLMNLTACCLNSYEEIVTGRIPITDVVFQNANMDVFTEVFQGGAVSGFFNSVVADTVRDAVVRLKGIAPKVRILEIGAGTGATTAPVLEVLQSFSGLVEFCFSDISPSFIRNARRRFAERYPSLEYRVLNIEDDLAAQGFEAHHFDIIVAVNVLHDTRDIEFTLKQVHRLLKTGGLLVLDEYTSVKDCLLFSGALLHGWWLFQDPERRLRDSCLLGVSHWIQALERTDFGLVGSYVLPTQSPDAACSQCVMLCEALGTNATVEPRLLGQIAEDQTPEDPIVEDQMGEETMRSMRWRKETVGAFIEKQTLVLLGEERASAFSAQRPLMDMGLDSVELVELKSLINERLGVKLSPMFLFEHETPEKMAVALSELVSNQQIQGLLGTGLGGACTDRSAARETMDVVVRPQGDAIAIVGVACRFPGGCVSAESFWKFLEKGKHGIVSLPPGRWQWPMYIDVAGKHSGIDKAGFLERIDEFDAPFFRTSPKEAELMDPQQRLLLELSWEAMEDAGHRPSELSGRKIGVFIGVCHGEYREVLTTASDSAEAYTSTGSADSLLANRLSYFYDLKGPSLTVDTACSSSLFALHDAVTAIRRGDCEQALVGAANLLCSPTNSISYYRAGMLSPTGKCRTFDETADGYVRGEGGAMVLLKPLAMALAEGDLIYGLVKGTAVNHGGQAVSLTAPKPEAQAAVIEAAWRAAGVPLESVGYIETHGTGTKLGDPVEVAGLIAAFRRLYQARGEAWPAQPRCGLGSVKTNVGHLEGAAGFAGLIKVLMAIRHRSIPATLNFERLNPDINLAGSPFYIVARHQTWPQSRDEWGREVPRRAGVSAFGFGGANAHAAIEEYPNSGYDAEAGDGQYLIPLSARNNERLLEQSRRLLEFLESGIDDGDPVTAARLSDVSYTLQVGREPMTERVAFVIRSREELREALHSFIVGDQTLPHCHRGRSETPSVRAETQAWSEQRQEIETSIVSRDLQTLASLWVSGVEIDWNRLYEADARRRIHLPTYPFARARYWISPPAESTAEKSARTLLHPLVHANTSDLSEQRFSSRFTGEEYFLAEHRVGGERLLPAAAYLEMAREAVARAVGGWEEPGEGRSIGFKDVVWVRPLVVGQEPVEVHIGLFAENGGEVDFEIYSRCSASAEEVVHVRGVGVVGAAVEAPRLDVEALAGRYQQHSYPGEVCYAALAGLGIEYGGGQRGIEGLHVEGEQVVARLSLPPGMWAEGLVLQPGMMDSGLQAMVGFALGEGSGNGGRGRPLPLQLDKAEIYGNCAPRMWAVVGRVTAVGGGSAGGYDIDLCDEAGRVCVRLSGLSTRSMEGEGEEGSEVMVEPQEQAIDSEQMRGQVQAALAAMIAKLLKVKSEDIKADSELGDLGFDSIMFEEFAMDLSDDYGVEVDSTVFFEHSTLEKFSRYLVARHGEELARHFARPSKVAAVGSLGGERSSQERRRERRRGARFASGQQGEEAGSRRESSEPIAIVGMSGRFPMAKDVEELWENLRSGRDCISEIPPQRWDWRAVYGESGQENKTNIKWGGFIEGVDEFDPLFFNISPREAELMDPQQRLLMMYVWKAIEDAGYAPLQLSGSKTGIFFGTGVSDYGRVMAQSKAGIEGYTATGTVASVGPNRMSYYLDLHGPSEPIETSCSSSLVAIHRAVGAMRSGQCEMAIVGGVNTILTPDLHISFNKAGMLSGEGRCKTFSDRADGYARSEGVGVLFLKKLSAAEAAGDHIYGVIMGSSENHGGRANWLTAPNPQAQAELLKQAYTESGVDPGSVSYIEAHGTGTALGDPIEIEGLKAAFTDLYRRWEEEVVAGQCGVGSVKSNIGHLELAAGVAGVIKVLLQMKHKTLVPSLHCETINPYIHLEGSPFYIVRETAEWVARRNEKGEEQPRRAGVSSFGFGGANAHVILEEYIPRGERRGGTSSLTLFPVVVVVSARSPERLREQVEQLLAGLRRGRYAESDLVDIAYTLQVGREPMEERLGLIVSSLRELEQRLEAFCQGGECPGLYRGQAGESDKVLTVLNGDKEFYGVVEKWMEQGRLQTLLELWVKGMQVDWERLYGETKPRRISLPTYPFAKDRYWVNTAVEQLAGKCAAAAPTAVLHPLLHSNTSDLSQPRYSSTFSGEEFFLADHQVANGHAGQKSLPGVAYLEMVRAAIAQAWPGQPEAILELHNTVWVQPVVVTQETQVSLSLLANEDDQIDYEIYTQDGEQDIVHCQGRAFWSRQVAPAVLDLKQLKAQMGRGKLEPSSVYAACGRMGLIYGPAFQAITAIHLGRGEVLAELQLPKVVDDTSGDYVLHPSLMDGALQAGVALIEGWAELFNQPPLPFALESLRITSACRQEMFAWVRYAPGSQAAGKVVKLDIDLCDESGKVCVEMRGFSSRVLRPEIKTMASEKAMGSLLAVPVWQARGMEGSAGASHRTYEEHHVILCELELVDAEKLESLLPRSQCLKLATGHKNIAGRYNEYALACFERIQALLRSKPQGKVLVQIVVPDHEEQALLAGLNGLLKTAALENPQLVGQLILTAPDLTTEELGQRLQAEKTGGRDGLIPEVLIEDALISYEAGERRVLSWQEVAAEEGKPPIAFRDQGVYLITGGLGGLGMVFAQEILDKTEQGRVVLTGRAALSAEKQARLNRLSAETGRASYRQLDLGDLDQVQQLIVAIQDEYGQLNGILHCAGMIADNFILKKAGAEFSQVLKPKVTGTYHLDQASREVDLDFFVLFSSIAGAMGNVGQADYATANGFMDQYAAYRNRLVAAGQRQGQTRSINWGLWQGGGMGIDQATEELLQLATGMQPMETATGLEAFYRSLTLPCDQMLVVAGEVTKIRRALLAGQALQPELSTLLSAGEASDAARSEGVTETDAEDIAPDRLVEKTQEYLRRQFSGLLKLPSQKIDTQAALEKYGIDSILALKLTHQLEKKFGALSKTLLFEYQSIGELAKYFIHSHGARLATLLATTGNGHRLGEAVTRGEETPVAVPPARVHGGRRFRHRQRACGPATQADAIAIIGLSGRYPEAINLDAYWQNLRAGKDCIIEVPKERWDWRAYFSEDRSKSGHHYSKWGGFISGVDEFDPLFFNISPKEAKYIDPQERLFLQHAWMAIEDAGYTRASLQMPCEQDLAGQVGVYVGVMYSEYQLFGAEASLQGRRLGIAGSFASIANRVSYVLNLHGPSMTVDTMCSSSLSAIHLACQDLKQGRTSLAIAGGVNVSIHPNKYLVLSAGQFISSEGHCQSFGEGGDGYIPGEGVGVVVLKRLSEAQRDGDHIYGIIRGSALTHGGKTNGYTVPNPQAQSSAIASALGEAKVGARHISYIEAHGTGTKLGDPIEIAALSKAFEHYTQDRGFCLLGSVKSNIGHCESAAGIAGLTKVLLQMQHEEMVPSLHSGQLNPHIDFGQSPFVVNQKLRRWERPVIGGREVARIAGISSFGAGGSNAHMIVEEYGGGEERRRGELGNKAAILLSARTGEQLKQKARDLLAFIRARQDRIDLEAMAYTLQLGREGMEKRLGVLGSRVEEVEEKLAAYVGGDGEIEDVYQGQVKTNKEALSLFARDADLQETVDKWLEQGKVGKLVELWVKGLEVDWNKLYGGSKPRRMSLPTYPFAKERYWVDRAVAGHGATTSAVLQPSLYSNASDLQNHGSPARKEIELSGYQQAKGIHWQHKKPVGISLAVPSTFVLAPAFENSMRRPSRGMVTIRLENASLGVPIQETAKARVSAFKLFDCGHGIFAIEITASAGSHTPVKEVLAQLLEALKRVQQEASLKVLLLSGLECCFSRGGREDYTEAVEQGLYETIVLFPYPVIAKLRDDATGAGFLAAALCDFIVCNEDATYEYNNANRHFYPTPAEAMLFSERFGAVQAQDFLYVARAATGKQLRSKGWTCPIVPGVEVDAYAEQLAATLATKPQEALGLLKQHLMRPLASLVKGLTRLAAATPAMEDASESLANIGLLAASSAEYIHLDTQLDNVVVIKFAVVKESRKVGIRELVADLGRVFAEIHQAGHCKAIVLASESADFLPEAEPATGEDVVLDLERLVMESSIPVVAALEGNAKGQAWLIGQFCDACVYSQSGIYSAGDMGPSWMVAQRAAAVFMHRLGNASGKEILLTGADYTGAELKQRVGGLLVVEQDQVLAEATQVAQGWTELPGATLASWKKHSATILQEKIAKLAAGAGWEEEEREEQREEAREGRAAPAAIALQSNVVRATAYPEGIVVVKMEERQAKNMFSEALVAGLREAFAHIEQRPCYKVVVLTGYDGYFACGGTKESLLAIQAGQARFSDNKIYQIALECKLPVIAAMQGHGIGAGWTLGMFADIVLLSEESRYVSPYMNYGFTPGAGASWVLGEQMGQDLARESLLTGQAYAGRELKARGLRLRVLPRGEVEVAAMELARQMARASRGRLRGLKQQWTGYVHQPLEEMYREELALHEKTFVGQPETLAQIEKNFYQEMDLPTAGGPLAAVEADNMSAGKDEVLAGVKASLKRLLANELETSESDIDEHTQFVDLGLDSISGVTWVRKINQKYQITIEAIKLYSYPTLAELSGYVKQEAEKQGILGSWEAACGAERVEGREQGGAVQNKVAANAAVNQATGQAGEELTSWRSRRASRWRSAAGAPAGEAIAVIGMAGQFPQARNVEEFWENLAEGKNCITQVPPQRWDVNVYYQAGAAVAGKTNSQWLGALEEYDRFDPLFFNISPTEAESMDPQQRLFLQACWHSIENAGYDAGALSGSKCGVFVGCAGGDYHELSRAHQLSAQGFTGNAMSILAARISYFLNLQGPCLAIDTACSSSLVAMANACDSLISGASDLALAGGVYVMAGPEMHIMTAQAGMLSAEGRCYSFDQRADGFVLGEGVGVVLLKRLADAERDGDIIYGVIQGWGVNQDGKTNGITAPNPESQTRLEQEVYERYQIDPGTIQLIEAHGTGTKLGDPIEVEGLKKAFEKYTQKQQYCAIGSVKSNIGHCLTAAGIAGVIKLVLALKHKQLPPTINFERLNEHIDLEGGPFYVNHRLQEWELRGGKRRQAAISSFGFSGTNAHIVIGEYVAPVAVTAPVTVVRENGKVIIPLSARTAEQLKQKARELREFLDQGAAGVDLVEMAHTLQVGRKAMEERAGFLVSSVEQLAEMLKGYIEGRLKTEDFYQGQLKRGRESISIIVQDEEMKETIVDRCIATKKLSKLAELWVQGLELDWNKLYGAVKPRRMSLPVYPFAKERYWIDKAEGGGLGGERAGILHPLLHRNTSDLSEQRYSSTFSGEEFFLSDHRVRIDGGTAVKVLPGVAYLEMARAAIEQAAPRPQGSSILELHNTLWLKPIIVPDHKQVCIVVFANENDRVVYEIYSVEDEQRTIHCQGEALFSHPSLPASLNIEEFMREMKYGKLEASAIYTRFAQMGICYGPAHQGIVAIYLGNDELLAQLRLPAVVETSHDEYVLHPSLIDSALQGAIGLVLGLNRTVSKPSVPFALDSVRIISPCTKEMLAWVRYTEGVTRQDRTIKVDIDICDQQGNVCAQMRGFSLRVLEGEIKSTHQSTTNNSAQYGANPAECHSPFDSAFYQKLIADVRSREVSVDEAVEIG